MALYALASAKGSPGVRVAALALAAAGRSPVVADFDPAGGDFLAVPRWRARDTDPPAVPGAAAAAAPLWPTSRDHPKGETSGEASRCLPARPTTQPGGIGPHGADPPQSACSAGTADVLVDCGRVVHGRPPPSCSPRAHVLFVVGPTTEGMARPCGIRLKAGPAGLILGAPAGVPVVVAVVTAYKD